MLNLGFIGVGGYGRHQLEGFLRLQESGRFRITALADPSPRALAEAAALPGLHRPAMYEDFRRMLDEAELDAVVVSAPIPAHKEITLCALRKDLFVLLEKPPVPLFSDLADLISADCRGRVMVGFQHIYRPLVQRMKEAVWSGEIGQPLSIAAYGLWPRNTEYYERSPWAGTLMREGRVTLDGPCTNAMAHFLNSLFFVAGEESYAQPERLEGEVYRVRPIESYDVGAMHGVLDNGLKFSAAFAHASVELQPVRLVVRGTEGEIELLENGNRLRAARGEVFTDDDGREAMRQAFLNFVEGERARNLTGLAACEAYVLSTNMMFQSSGGIHSVGPEYALSHEPGSPHGTYSLPGLEQLFETSASRLESLAKAGAPWAITPNQLTRAEFDEQEMLGLLLDQEVPV